MTEHFLNKLQVVGYCGDVCGYRGAKSAWSNWFTEACVPFNSFAHRTQLSIGERVFSSDNKFICFAF